VILRQAPVGWGDPERGEIDFGAGQDDQIDAAVFCAAVLSVVAGHGVELGIAGGGEAVGGHGFQVEEDAGDAGGAGRGELPVGVEFGGVDGNVVGVALDAQVVGSAAQRGGDLAQRGQRLGRGVAEPELKKPASRRLMTRPSRPIWMETVCWATWLESVCSTRGGYG
jgi:hypothetical protein